MYKTVFQYVIHIKITETPDILFLAKSSAAGVYCTLQGISIWTAFQAPSGHMWLVAVVLDSTRLVS